MIFFCLNCGKENKFKSNTHNKYCNNKCQQEFQNKNKVRLWLEEGKSWSLQIPVWAKKYLISLRGYKCEVCGIYEWNNKQINLECDHIDGVHYNNDPSNLRLICPNCHSQTHTFKNNNRGKGRTLNKLP